MEHAELILQKAVAERLKALETNAFAFEQAHGLPEDAVRSILSGTKKLGTSLNKAQVVCEALGLELYIGPPRDIGPQPQVAASEAFALVPLHEALLAAGEGIENQSEIVTDHMAFKRDWLRKIGVAPANAALARVRGDSMEPVIWDGDLVLLDESKKDPPPIAKPDKTNRVAPIFALLDDGCAKVKRLQMLDHKVAMLISDNPDYPPQLANIENLSIIGKVLWWGHTNRD